MVVFDREIEMGKLATLFTLVLMFCAFALPESAMAKSGASVGGGSFAPVSKPAHQTRPSRTYHAPVHTSPSTPTESSSDSVTESLFSSNSDQSDTSSSNETSPIIFLIFFALFAIFMVGMFIQDKLPSGFSDTDPYDSDMTWTYPKNLPPSSEPALIKAPIRTTNHATVTHFELGFDDPLRRVQHRLDELAKQATLDTPQGRIAYVQALALMLIRNQGVVTHGRIALHNFSDMGLAESKMNALEIETRAKFDRDTMLKDEHNTTHNVRNITAPDALFDEDGDFELHEALVLTLIVATHDHLGIQSAISQRPALAKQLQTLSGLTESNLIRVSVTWTPSAESDAMSVTEMVTTYPEMIDVG